MQRCHPSAVPDAIVHVWNATATCHTFTVTACPSQSPQDATFQSLLSAASFFFCCAWLWTRIIVTSTLVILVTYSQLHCVSKKVPTFKLSVTLSNLNRFSKFLHCWKAYEICYKNDTRHSVVTCDAAMLAKQMLFLASVCQSVCLYPCKKIGLRKLTIN